jgi:uncharacterized protein DUF262/uncharacterized protein DUF1524
VEAGPRSVKVIFEQDRRLVVPLFQRPYVWTREDQWEPLWGDIRRLAERVLSGKEVRAHFLGAIVLDQVRKPTGHVETRTVIDGQQRLTTLQLFLEAFSDFCQARSDERHGKALLKLTRNSDPLSEDKDEDFKVWPTNADQDHFRRVMNVASPQELLREYGKKDSAAEVGRPIADAYLFFYSMIDEWVGSDKAAVSGRIAALYSAIREHLQMVVIDLGRDDDAQMIFETLNARGTPLLPSDLIKNFLFHELQKEGHTLESLYAKYWRKFDEDDEYWREEVGRGHARRHRIDIFLQHYLTLRSEDEVEVGHLYSKFRDFVRDGSTGARQHLEDLQKYATIFRSFSNFKPQTREGRFFARLELLDVGTAYPFLLELFNRFGDDNEAVGETLAWLESWLVRRMVCQLNTRAYNQFFITLLKKLKGGADGLSDRIKAVLLASDAESNRWPNDKDFRRAWTETPVYWDIVRQRVRLILEALELALHSAKTEKVTLDETLTIEHVMPQGWRRHWPLPDDDNDEEAAEERERLIQTLGNLTLLTKRLNPSVSNGPWKTKRAELRKHSVLKLNVDVIDHGEWDEDTIRERGVALFEIAKKIWPLPK